MQPYIFPYIGYFQLIQACDQFVVYDNIQFTKKGWINRNRILLGDGVDYFTLPLKKASDYLNVVDRVLADDFPEQAANILRRISASYAKAPQFPEVFPLIESIFLQPERNLFRFIYQALQQVCDYLGITTPLVVSSGISIDHSLRSQDKVIAICRSLGANRYINASGGKELYDPVVFREQDLELRFIQTGDITYRQFREPFHPWLSVIDVMMFNDRSVIRDFLNNYTLQ